MIAGTKARMAIGLTCVLMFLVPAGARAADLRIDEVEVLPEKLFANNVLTRAGRGAVWFEGHASGGATKVIVTATDGETPGLEATRTVPAEQLNDGYGDLHPGDFRGDLNVTPLGKHKVDPSIVNRPPRLTFPQPLTVDPGTPANFRIFTSDADGDTVTLEALSLPTGATFNATNGQFTWTPSAAQAGSYRIAIVGTDGKGQAAVGTALVTVRGDAAPNGDPAVTAPASIVVEPGEEVSFQVRTGDPDDDPAPLVARSIPDGAVFDPITGSFNWIPGSSDAGNRTVAFANSDGKGGADVRATTISVVDGSKLGASEITLSFVAVDAAGNRSAPVTRTITKFAGTPGDVKPPLVFMNAQTGPPQNWCHVVATKDGACALAVQGTSVFVPWFAAGPFSTPPSGIARVFGLAEDSSRSSLGIASEIAEVLVRVYRADGTLATETPASFVRGGTSAQFIALLHIDDYSPNPPGQSYRCAVVARDAWGNEDVETPCPLFNVFAI